MCRHFVCISTNVQRIHLYAIFASGIDIWYRSMVCRLFCLFFFCPFEKVTRKIDKPSAAPANWKFEKRQKERDRDGERQTDKKKTEEITLRNSSEYSYSLQTAARWNPHSKGLMWTLSQINTHAHRTVQITFSNFSFSASMRSANLIICNNNDLTHHALHHPSCSMWAVNIIWNSFLALLNATHECLLPVPRIIEQYIHISVKLISFLLRSRRWFGHSISVFIPIGFWHWNANAAFGRSGAAEKKRSKK